MPSRVGQGEGLLIVDFVLYDVRGMAMQSDLAQKPQRPGLVAACLVGPGERQRPLGEGVASSRFPARR